MPLDQVEEVKQKTDIVSVISESIGLKKAGRNFKGLCPFHNEKTPSFMVSPELQIYKCFGCGESGDVFNFLQNYDGMDFGEALKILAEKGGVKLKPTTFRSKGEKERLYEINLLVSKFYQYILLNHSKGREALNYLKKDRGIKLSSIKKFGLGFSPGDSKILTNFLIGKKKIHPNELVKAGMVYKGRGGFVDRLNGRVIFSLFDHRGNSIGFAGRLLPSDKRDFAKYINTPETPVYHKGNVLYGLDQTRSFIKRKNTAIVVEGELDLISSFQAGIKNVVATKGTALTDDQVRILSRFAKKVILALDADFAGNEAARRGIAIAQNQGLEIGVSLMGEYKDPDEAARKNPEEYKKALIDNKDVWEFVIDFVLSKYDVKSGHGKASISRELSGILASIEDKIVQSHYVKYLADRLEVSEESVAGQVSSVFEKNKKSEAEKETKKPKEKSRREKIEERLLVLFFNSERKKDDEILKLVKTVFAKKIINFYLSFKGKGKKFSIKKFSRSLPNELKVGFAELVLKIDENLMEDLEKFEKEYDLVMRELKKIDLKEKRSELVSKIKNLEKKGEVKKAKKLSLRFDELGKELSKLEKE